MSSPLTTPATSCTRRTRRRWLRCGPPTGVAGAWKDIDCVGTSLCVAVDNGLVATTTNPAADAPTWNRRSIPAGDLVVGVVPVDVRSAMPSHRRRGDRLFDRIPSSATRDVVPAAKTRWRRHRRPAASRRSRALRPACASSATRPATVFATTNPASDSPPDLDEHPDRWRGAHRCRVPGARRCASPRQADLKTASSANAGAAPAGLGRAGRRAGSASSVACRQTFCVGFGDGAVATSISPPAAWSAPVPIGKRPQASPTCRARPPRRFAWRWTPSARSFTVSPRRRTRSLPTVAGTAEIGQTLTATAGTWSAVPALTYQWMRCDGGGSGCAPIGGATAATYTVAADDATHTLRVQETATNGGGTATADSAATGAVPSPPGPGGGPGPGAVRHDAARRDVAAGGSISTSSSGRLRRALGAYGQGGEARQPA